MSEVVKSQDRLDVLKKIEELETEGKFDVDPEIDPESRTIMPNEVDYLRRKLSSKIKFKIADKQARKFLNGLIESKGLIIKDIVGIENLRDLKSGAVVTCNHFNAMDSFATQIAFEKAFGVHKKKFFRIIKEGNYTSFPGFFGFLMRNYNTLPLSSNAKALKQMMNATEEILKRGDLVLIYPEQSMWWNYRKPKPLKKGAFQFAVKAMVPVVPVFITMNDSDIIGPDGFNIQEYTINISKPIYPDKEKNTKQNIDYMLSENYNEWKNIYERVYGIPLEYLCDKK